jgi:hypothetical protein
MSLSQTCSFEFEESSSCEAKTSAVPPADAAERVILERSSRAVAGHLLGSFAVRWIAAQR